MRFKVELHNNTLYSAEVYLETANMSLQRNTSGVMYLVIEYFSQTTYSMQITTALKLYSLIVLVAVNRALIPTH